MTTSASAQTANEHAGALFEEAKRLMAQGKFAEACVAFERSQELEPNISTLLNHANCREKNLQLATAWRLFALAEQQTRAQPDATAKQLAATAAERAGKLEARLSKLSIDVAPDHRLEGLEIRRDTTLIDPGEWNRALPIDGGTYLITARAPGRVEWSAQVVVKPERDVRAIVVPKLDPRPPPPPEVRPPTPPAPAPPSLAPPTLAPPGEMPPPGLAPLPAPPPPREGKPLSAGLASALSIGGTLAATGILVGAGYLYDVEPSAGTAMAAGAGLGLLIAPSAGHWYAGKYLPRGMWLRLAGTAAVGTSLLVARSSDSFTDAGSAILLFLGGAVVFVVGAVDDMITASGRVSRYNRARGFAIAPLVTPTAGGLALGGRF